MKFETNSIVGRSNSDEAVKNIEDVGRPAIFGGSTSISNSSCDGKNISTTSVEVDKTLLGFVIGKGYCIFSFQTIVWFHMSFRFCAKHLPWDIGLWMMDVQKRNWRKTMKLLYQFSTMTEAKHCSRVVINGREASVKAASTAIQKILDDAVQNKLPYTHFISLPLALHAPLIEKVTNFQQSILASIEPPLVGSESSSSDYRKYHSSGIDKSIFVKPATFHLTVLMLKLWNQERVMAASDVLQSIAPSLHKALAGQHLSVTLQGVECLRGSPEKAHVLYAKVQDSIHKSRLLQACQVMTRAFIEAGLVTEKDGGQDLTLHATLMNTSNRRTTETERSSKRIPIDAREILAKYGNWDWGEYGILEVHLSQRSVYDKNGYYHCVSSIPFT